MRVDGRVIVVTGAAGGIGRALTLELLRRGASVAAVDRDGPALQDLVGVAGAGEALTTHVVDLTDRDAVAALPDAVVGAHGAVDGVVNNAGIIQPFVPFTALDEATMDRVLQVNLHGTLHMLRAFLPRLTARPDAHVVNVSSMGGFMPFPGQSMYGASKAAVRLLTEGLYAELADTAVDVSVVMPGAVDTQITAHSGVEVPGGASAEDSPMKPLPPAEAARIVVDGMERGRLHILVGRDATVLWWLQRLAPAWSIRFIQRQMAKRMGGS